MRKIFMVMLSFSLIFASSVTVFAADFNDEFDNAIPQVVVEENIIEENGHIVHEYTWRDKPMLFSAEDDQLANATWLKTTDLPYGTLRHRGAKISPNAGSSAWYACAQTDYAGWHYTRAQIIKTLTGKVLEDSNQVQIDSGISTARTPKDKLYLLDWDFSMRSAWGIE